MNKIGLIIRREYITRVRKRSFIIMAILGPILFASLMVVPANFRIPSRLFEKRALNRISRF